MKMTIAKKLKLGWEILTMGTQWTWPAHKGENEWIFRKGYLTGLEDAKLPGLYKVTTHKYEKQASFTYTFNDIQEAVDFVDRFYGNSTNPGDSCDFVATYLDRDMSHLLDSYIKPNYISFIPGQKS